MGNGRKGYQDMVESEGRSKNEMVACKMSLENLTVLPGLCYWLTIKAMYRLMQWKL